MRVPAQRGNGGSIFHCLDSLQSSKVRREHQLRGGIAKKKYFLISLIVLVSVGTFAPVGSLAAEDQASKVIVVGAKQMMDGSQKITAIMENKGIKDPELTNA